MMVIEKIMVDLNNYREEFNKWLMDEYTSSIKGDDLLDYTTIELTRYLAIQEIVKKWLELSDEHISDWIEQFPKAT